MSSTISTFSRLIACQGVKKGLTAPPGMIIINEKCSRRGPYEMALRHRRVSLTGAARDTAHDQHVEKALRLSEEGHNAFFAIWEKLQIEREKGADDDAHA